MTTPRDDLEAQGVPELLPCPFCGGTPHLQLQEKRAIGAYYTIRCCKIDDFSAWTELPEIVAAWNTRALLDARAERDLLRADAKAAHEKGMDEASDKILDWLANAVGAKQYSACDGSETWDGDVHGTIYAILKAGGVYDDDTGTVAHLSDAEAAVALVVERAVRGVSDLTHWTGDDDHGTTLVALQEAITAIRAEAATILKGETP